MDANMKRLALLIDLVAPAPHPNDCSGPGSLARARREWAEREMRGGGDEGTGMFPTKEG
jgi:hypothetical protein